MIRLILLRGSSRHSWPTPVADGEWSDQSRRFVDSPPPLDTEAFRSVTLPAVLNLLSVSEKTEATLTPSAEELVTVTLRFILLMSDLTSFAHVTLCRRTLSKTLSSR